MVSALRALLNVISDAVDNIEESCRSRSVELPTVDAAFEPLPEAARADPVVQRAAFHIVSAASQLVATAREPTLTIMAEMYGFHISSGLRVATEANIPELLREEGPNGVHVDIIGKKTRIEAAKIARILRTLATHYIFCESAPNVFSNNTLSSLLDTGKEFETISQNPLQKHPGTTGLPAFVGCTTDEIFKASSYLWEHLRSGPAHGKEDSRNSESPFTLAVNTDLNLFQWYELPENSYRMHRFGVATGTSALTEYPAGKGFPWHAVGTGLMVDVGGGLGASSLAIVKANPSLRVIVQDRPSVVERGETYWKAKMPEALDSGRVQLQSHNFFQPQPVKNASVFFLRFVIHDWPDELARVILNHLRDAASISTKLILQDYVISHVCHEKDSIVQTGRAPAPLLANFGPAASGPYLADMQMMVILKGQERTQEHWVQLLESSGWRLLEILNLKDEVGGARQLVADMLNPSGQDTS